MQAHSVVIRWRPDMWWAFFDGRLQAHLHAETPEDLKSAVLAAWPDAKISIEERPAPLTIYDPEAATDEELSHPDFENAGKVHDWRNHVGRETKVLWPTFSPEQRRAIALDAAEDASNEHWD